MQNKSKRKGTKADSPYITRPVYFGPHDKDLLEEWLPRQGAFSTYIKRLIREDQRRGGSLPTDPLEEKVAALVAKELRRQGGSAPRTPGPLPPSEALKGEGAKVNAGDTPPKAMLGGLF